MDKNKTQLQADKPTKTFSTTAPEIVKAKERQGKILRWTKLGKLVWAFPLLAIARAERHEEHVSSIIY